jgi:hypothetical protein
MKTLAGMVLGMFLLLAFSPITLTFNWQGVSHTIHLGQSNPMAPLETSSDSSQIATQNVPTDTVHTVPEDMPVQKLLNNTNESEEPSPFDVKTK